MSSKAKRLAKIVQQSSYWKGHRDRIRERGVFPTWDPVSGRRILVMAPQVVAHNTVSLRTGENLILVLASHVVPKPGAEIKGKFKAPEGWNIVSYDFQSQELQGLSAYSASYFGISGSTAFDHANIVGTTAEKTDIHSLVASFGGVTRDCAKPCNYAVSYGGGVKTVAKTVIIHNPLFSKPKAEDFAWNIIVSYRGKKNYDTNRYEGGSGSFAFNKMLDLLGKPFPSTPMLGTAMAPAMWPKNSGDYGAPGQMNFFVQSLGSSMLQATLVANWYYADKINLTAPLCVTMHDEEVFMTPEKESTTFAYIQQITHAMTWALLHYKLKIFDLPVNRAFMEVSIDKIWRKDPKKEVITPTFSYTKLGEEYSFQRLVECGAMDAFKKKMSSC